MNRKNGKILKLCLIVASVLVLLTLFLPILKVSSDTENVAQNGIDIIKTLFAGDEQFGLFNGDSAGQVYLQEYLKTDGYTIFTEIFMYSYFAVICFSGITLILSLLYSFNAIFPPDNVHLILVILSACIGVFAFIFACVMTQVQTDAIASSTLALGSFMLFLPMVYIPIFVKSAYYY